MVNLVSANNHANQTIAKRTSEKTPTNYIILPLFVIVRRFGYFSKDYIRIEMS